MLKNLTVEAKYEKAEVEKNILEKMTETMSNDMKTPLDVVQQSMSLLVNAEKDARNLAMMKMVQNANIMMMCIVNDYLDYTMLKKSEFRARTEAFQVRPVMKTVLEIFKLQSEAKRIKFAVNFHSSVPKNLQMDKQRLLQVLRNYVGNALKYTREGKIGIQINYNWASAWLEVEVWDTGVGIRADNIPNLFKPFT